VGIIKRACKGKYVVKNNVYSIYGLMAYYGACADFRELIREASKMIMRFYADEWESFIANCGFTDDELEIVPFLRRGWACIDIAEELCISVSTLKRRRSRIGKKIVRYISRQK
jgi:DNA-binding NarL/FixJ family response regulator